MQGRSGAVETLQDVRGPCSVGESKEPHCHHRNVKEPHLLFLVTVTDCTESYTRIERSGSPPYRPRCMSYMVIDPRSLAPWAADRTPAASPFAKRSSEQLG